MKDVMYYYLSEARNEFGQNFEDVAGNTSCEGLDEYFTRYLSLCPKETWNEAKDDEEGPGLYGLFIPEIQPILKELQASCTAEDTYSVKPSVTEDILKNVIRKHDYEPMPYPWLDSK